MSSEEWGAVPTPVEWHAAMERLARIECENRRWRSAVLAGLLTIVATLLMGQARPAPRVVEAERFVLRDGRGIKRAEWVAGDENAYLAFYDERGETRTWLGAGEYGALSLSEGPDGALLHASASMLALLADSTLIRFDPRAHGSSSFLQGSHATADPPSDLAAGRTVFWQGPRAEPPSLSRPAPPERTIFWAGRH